MTALEVEDIQNICITNCGWEKLRNKTIFISGGTGFIGSIFVDAVQYRNRCFGDGTVTSVEGSGIDAKATINFDNIGIKKMLLKFAKIKKI